MTDQAQEEMHPEAPKKSTGSNLQCSCSDNRKKRRPETIWRLVDTRCKLLTESVSAARVPFLLCLIWSFLWAWTLYNADFGYLNILRERYNRMETLSRINPAARPFTWPSYDPEFTGLCKKYGMAPEFLKERNSPEQAYLDHLYHLICKSAVENRLQWTNTEWSNSRMVAFPWGFPKVHISDLGVIGGAAILLLLVWFFFAARRENHAIKSFVDIDTASRKLGYVFPKAFTLEPQDPLLSSEHMAYAYHAVSQRFVFLFSTFSRPLVALTLFLCAIPALVAVWNFATDVRDIARYDFERAVIIGVIAEAVILIPILMATWGILKFVRDTSVLLNAWYLTADQVWTREWDESTDDPAPAADIDVHRQTAKARVRVRAVTQPAGGCIERCCCDSANRYPLQL